ncbi:hypothetical protein GO613_06930 [Azoarcus communis]|uniref:nitrous oxide reductase accessory protein NosL n=1 Tax=Parazoarcus communis TaxID=41977 RepID=UPI001459D100|nr:nitrous oxide reductase accessory protein NosL [Parazoarcus communis]NMG47829.1 hypothetical protein [Parazoarcus communis]
MTLTSGTRRRILLGLSGASLLGASALFVKFTMGTRVDFQPAPEDFCIVASAPFAQAHPWDPTSGLGQYDARPVPAQARCPVCGMYPARHPAWAAQLIFTDGSAHFFDSPVDLLLFLEAPARFDPEHSVADVAVIHVTDHGSRQWTDGRHAYVVLGSGVHGPMRGPDLPAFADPAAAMAFSQQHGGQAVRLTDIDTQTLARLRDGLHGGTPQ